MSVSDDKCEYSQCGNSASGVWSATGLSARKYIVRACSLEHAKLALQERVDRENVSRLVDALAPPYLGETRGQAATGTKAAELDRIADWASIVGEERVRDLCREAAHLLRITEHAADPEPRSLPPAPFLDMGDRIITAAGEVPGGFLAGEVRIIPKCPYCGSTKMRAEETQNVCQECGKGMSVAGALLSGKSLPEVAEEFNLEPVRRDRSHDIPQGIPEEQG